MGLLRKLDTRVMIQDVSTLFFVLTLSLETAGSPWIILPLLPLLYLLTFRFVLLHFSMNKKTTVVVKFHASVEVRQKGSLIDKKASRLL